MEIVLIYSLYHISYFFLSHVIKIQCYKMLTVLYKYFGPAALVLKNTRSCAQHPPHELICAF